MKRILTAVVASSLLLSGCYTLSYDLTSLPDNAAQMTPSAEGSTGRHFIAEDKAYFLLSGLVPVSKPDLSAIVQREARGKRVQNLKIKSEQSFTDGLIAVGLGFAAGLIASGMTAAGGGDLLRGVRRLAGQRRSQFVDPPDAHRHDRG